MKLNFPGGPKYSEEYLKPFALFHVRTEIKTFSGSWTSKLSNNKANRFNSPHYLSHITYRLLNYSLISIQRQLNRPSDTLQPFMHLNNTSRHPGNNNNNNPHGILLNWMQMCLFLIKYLTSSILMNSALYTQVTTSNSRSGLCLLSLAVYVCIFNMEYVIYLCFCHLFCLWSLVEIWSANGNIAVNQVVYCAVVEWRLVIYLQQATIFLLVLNV